MDCSSPGSSVHRILQARILGGLPHPPPGDLLDPGIESTFLASLAFAGGFFVPPGTGSRILMCVCVCVCVCIMMKTLQLRFGAQR